MEPQLASSQRKPLIVAGICLGIGLGGFFDGIVLHQILQWHHMLSNVKPLTNRPNIDLNVLGDGIFHVFDFLMTVIGIVLLWQAGKRNDLAWSSTTFFGSIAIGVGLFDLIEGIIDHQILRVHHVKPGPNEFAWDMGFLALGTLIAVIGWLMLQQTGKSTMKN
ncbi:DUF2243 domain-containing protein [Plectonema cf. radiosum LEGE 06105]|uniref:DUF2243 domain-containing protein n=1 Tax=Plectonema cf. radiosum LEGE 06105 TaxID=945769 RepID=A0A8J7EZR8_9CYAN|nr:DUF2243 domain-containing protein [Plectonema radiosum]MBE9213216.1 DUF2243 domain-containing protein [Plectonema cf. radiosum LEGE 06105]